MKVATKIQLLRYSNMIQEMMQNMLGDYAKYVTPMGNGQIRINLPKDLNNPSMEDATVVDLDTNQVLSLMNICLQPKKYQVDDRTISEGDSEFDINKWAMLAINSIKK